jgi:hypothetical protein
MKDRFLVISAVAAFVILVPYMITLIVNGGGSGSESVLDVVSSGRDVIISDSGKNYLVDVEKFVAMCLPSLIEWNSDEEMLEAQAVAVRSRIIYSMGSETVVNASELGYTYLTEQKLKELVGTASYLSARKKYEQAVYDTLGVTQ